VGLGTDAAARGPEREPEPERFAVKVIAKGSLSEGERELLRSEIAILKLVQHPHIVRYEAVFETAEALYIVMELLEGGELFTNIVGRSRFSEAEARALIRPLVDSVAYLAALGCVHRDLKPENILCSGGRSRAAGTGSESGSGASASSASFFAWGDIKIADFGLSALVHPGEILTQPCGTLQYAAPEVLSRAGYGKPADMWSLGVLLYLVVRGKLPFDFPNRDDMIRAILSDPIDFSHPVWERWSPEGLSFVQGLLERDPAKRLTARGALQHPWLRSSDAERDRGRRGR
jgi:serine/threonine protein kinase